MTLSPDQLLQRAQALSDLGRLDEALRLIRQGLASEPENLELLLLATTLALQLDKYTEAAEAAQALAGAAPAWGLPLALLAQARRMGGDTQGGLRAAEDALRLDPDTGLAHFERGIAKATEAENAPFWRRSALLHQAREAAERLEELWPGRADGPALHALVSLMQRQWSLHEAELARALSREPDDVFAHNVRLAGLRVRRRRELPAELVQRLREHPEDTFARNSLREHFGFQAWLEGWGNFRPLILVVLSLPFYGLWRQQRIWRNRAAYQAAFTPRERRLNAFKHFPLILLALMALFMLLEHVYPLAFTSRMLWYGPPWLLVFLCGLGVSVPAALSGQGGFFGRPLDAPLPPRPLARPLTFLSALGPGLLGLLAFNFSLGTLASLYFTLSAGLPSLRDSWAGLLLMLALSLALILLTMQGFERARYGAVLPKRFSPSDALLSLGLLVMLGMVADSLAETWRLRTVRHGTLRAGGERLSYWQYEDGSALEDLSSAKNEACGLPEAARYAAVAVPAGTRRGFVLEGRAAVVEEHPEQTACLSAVKVQKGYALRAFPWPGQPLNLRKAQP